MRRKNIAKNNSVPVRLASEEEVELVKRTFLDVHYMEILRCFGMQKREELHSQSNINGKACMAAFITACCLIEVAGRHLTKGDGESAFLHFVKLMNKDAVVPYNAKQLYRVGRCGMLHGLSLDHSEFEKTLAITHTPQSPSFSILLLNCTGNDDTKEFDVIYLQRFIMDIGATLDKSFEKPYSDLFLECVARGTDSCGRLIAHQVVLGRIYDEPKV